MRISFLAAIYLLFILGLGACHPAQAKEYSLPAIRVEAKLRADGSIRITEYRTYKFEGSFSWADYRLPFKGFTSVEDIQIKENGHIYRNKNSEKTGTFLVQRNDDRIRLKWFYHAEDEQRTFAISYTLKGAVVIGPAWCEFFWNYISSDREKDTDFLHIRMELPRSISKDSLYAWKRGPLNQLDLQQNTNGYTVTATNIDDDEFVKIRTVFPRSVLNRAGVTTTDPNFSLTRARIEEKSYQREQAMQLKRQARYAGYGQKVAVIVSLLSIIGFIFFYRKYGKRHTNDTIFTESLMVPGDLKPAVAGWLLQGRAINSNLLMATLLDLARRKYFIIEEQQGEKKWWRGRKKIFTIKKSDPGSPDNLTGWEASVVEYVNEQIKNGNSRIDKLFSESSYHVSKWFSRWKNKLKEYGNANGWYDRKSFTGVYANMVIQTFFAVFAGLCVYWAGPVGVIPICITIAMLALSAAIIRRTSNGEKTYHRWKAYKDGLKHAEYHTVEESILDTHFIYAVAFGLSEKHLETLFIQCGESNITFYWFIFYGNQIPAAEIANTFSTLTATGIAAFPGTSSGGAGASAGAAGGGAAGGAG